jgi:anti-sigma regulatory factor (Ser/Thr protein kinase)
MPDTETLKFSVDGGIDAASTARYTVTDGLGSDVERRTIEDVLLVISELVTNAVRHAGAGRDETIDVCVTNRGETILIEVVDREPDSTPRMRDDEAPGGMGLMVVSGLCKDWGTRQQKGRKTVWAEYSLAGAEQAVP